MIILGKFLCQSSSDLLAHSISRHIWSLRGLFSQQRISHIWKETNFLFCYSKFARNLIVFIHHSNILFCLCFSNSLKNVILGGTLVNQVRLFFLRIIIKIFYTLWILNYHLLWRNLWLFSWIWNLWDLIRMYNCWLL
jgi:hypothetical protein